MPIFIVGRGHLGRYLEATLRDRYGFAVTLLEERLEDIPASVLEDPAAAIINAAGKTDLAWCEAHPHETMEDNAYRPMALNTQRSGRLIQLGSGCVWDGPYKPDGTPFGPGDPPTPACVYAQSKAFCDYRMFRDRPRGLASLRLRMPYSPVRSDRNLLTKLSGYPSLLQDAQSITSADTLARTVHHLLVHDDCGLWGRASCVYDRGITSVYEIGVLLAEAGLRAMPTVLEKSDLDEWHKPKRVSTVMSDPEFEREVKPPEVRVELRRVIDLYAGASKNIDTPNVSL